MHSFTDAENRKWRICINVAALKKCRNLLEEDLMALVDDGFESLNAFLNNPIRLVDVIYVLCQDQAEKASVSDEDFGRAMAGGAIKDAATAFVEELADFFPDPRVGAGLKKLMRAGELMATRLMEHAQKELDELDPEAEARKLIKRLPSVQASSVSTPTP